MLMFESQGFVPRVQPSLCPQPPETYYLASSTCTTFSGLASDLFQISGDLTS